MKQVLYHHSEEKHAMWQLGVLPQAPLVFENGDLARRFKNTVIPDTDWGDEWEPYAIDADELEKLCRPYGGYYLQPEPTRFAWVPLGVK